MELADERTGLVARQGPLRVVGTATRITIVHGLYAVVDSKQEFQNGPEPATCSYAVVLPDHVTVSSLVPTCMSCGGRKKAHMHIPRLLSFVALAVQLQTATMPDGTILVAKVVPKAEAVAMFRRAACAGVTAFNGPTSDARPDVFCTAVGALPAAARVTITISFVLPTISQGPGEAAWYRMYLILPPPLLQEINRLWR
jgi:hypothetical protein